MDFSALGLAQKQTRQHNLIRQDQSEKLVSDALTSIQLYNQTLDTSCIRKALETLVQAVTAQRSNGRAYYLIAYLYYAIRQDRLAIKYLNLATSLVPDMPELNILRDKLSRGERLPLLNQQNLSIDPGGIDSDETNDRLEAQLKGLMGSLTQEISRTPSADQEFIQKLTDLLENYRSQVLMISQLVADLEKEQDCSHLLLALQSIEDRLSSLARIIKVSKEFFSFRQAVQTLEARLETLYFPGAEMHLDEILDACDRFADQLDEWERFRLNLHSVKPDYDHLIVAVENLQDWLESCTDG